MSEVIKTFLQHMDSAKRDEEIGILKERIKYLEGLLDKVRKSFAYKIYSNTGICQFFSYNVSGATFAPFGQEIVPPFQIQEYED